LSFDVREPVLGALLLAEKIANRFVAEVADRAELNGNVVSVGRFDSATQAKITSWAWVVIVG